MPFIRVTIRLPCLNVSALTTVTWLCSLFYQHLAQHVTPQRCFTIFSMNEEAHHPVQEQGAEGGLDRPCPGPLSSGRAPARSPSLRGGLGIAAAADSTPRGKGPPAQIHTAWPLGTHHQSPVPGPHCPWIQVSSPQEGLWPPARPLASELMLTRHGGHVPRGHGPTGRQSRRRGRSWGRERGRGRLPLAPLAGAVPILSPRV